MRTPFSASGATSTCSIGRRQGVVDTAGKDQLDVFGLDLAG